MVELIQLASAAATSARLAVCERSLIRLANSGFNASTLCKSFSDSTPARDTVGDSSAAITQRPKRLRRASAAIENPFRPNPSHIKKRPTFARYIGLLLGDAVRAIMPASWSGPLAADFENCRARKAGAANGRIRG